MNLLCFKLNRVCLDLLIMSNPGDFSSGVEFLRILSRFKNGNENSGSSVHVLHKTSHFEVARRSRAVGMVGHLFQNYDTIYVRFFPTYTCNHSCYTIYVRFFVTYTCAYICLTNKHVVYGVTESRRIRGTELYRQQKTPSCTMELKSNFSLNQAWLQCPR